MIKTSKRNFVLACLLSILLLFSGVGCKTLLCRTGTPGTLPTVSNLGAYVSGDTAYMMYGAVRHAEDGWQIEQFVRQNKCTKLVLYMVNGGGSVLIMFDVCSALTAMRNDGIHITTVGSGLVASAAVPIFVQGDVRILRKDAMVMLHPGSWQGEEKELQPSECELAERWEHAYARIMSERTRMTEEEIYTLMNTGNSRTGQVFYTAEEALALGIATEIE